MMTKHARVTEPRSGMRSMFTSGGRTEKRIPRYDNKGRQVGWERTDLQAAATLAWLRATTSEVRV